MLNLVRRFWKLVLAGAALLGIYWMPKDVEDRQEAAKPWLDLWTMVDQNSLLWVFAVVLFLWLVWVETRAIFYRWIGYQPIRKDNNWRPKITNRLEPVRRLALPVTIETNRNLHMNAQSAPDAVNFSVYAVALAGRNNRAKDIDISGHLQVEDKDIRIPLFFRVGGENRSENGIARIGGFENFTATASLTRPNSGELVCDNRISDAQFLRQYAPFRITMRIGEKTWTRRFSYSRVRAEIDHERDRVLFYDQNKID